MFEPNFVFSPTPSTDDNFFAFVEAPSVDEGAAVAQQLMNSKPAPLKIPAAKDVQAVAKLLTSPQVVKQPDSFLQLLDENFGPADFLLSPAAPQQPAINEQFLPAFAPETPIIAAQQEVAAPVQKKKLNRKAPAAPATKAAKQTVALDPERTFKTVYVNNDIVQSGDITLKMKTRRDQASESIPERLYNSIKYNLIQTASGFPENLPLIIARIRAVDAETLEPVKKNNKEVLKGTVETALTKPTQTSAHQFEGQLYVQFTEVSYHVDKREYCFEIAYYIREDLENPIMIKRSAPFKTFARKPNKKRPKKNDKKQDSAMEEDEDANDSDEEVALEQPLPKKQKNTQNYDAFVAKAEELFEFNKKLGEDERKKAMTLVIQKFYQIDPVYTTTVLLPSAANSFLSFAPQVAPQQPTGFRMN